MVRVVLTILVLRRLPRAGRYLAQWIIAILPTPNSLRPALAIGVLRHYSSLLFRARLLLFTQARPLADRPTTCLEIHSLILPRSGLMNILGRRGRPRVTS